MVVHRESYSCKWRDCWTSSRVMDSFQRLVPFCEGVFDHTVDNFYLNWQVLRTKYHRFPNSVKSQLFNTGLPTLCKENTHKHTHSCVQVKGKVLRIKEGLATQFYYLRHKIVLFERLKDWRWLQASGTSCSLSCVQHTGGITGGKDSAVM